MAGHTRGGGRGRRPVKRKRAEPVDPEMLVDEGDGDAEKPLAAVDGFRDPSNPLALVKPEPLTIATLRREQMALLDSLPKTSRERLQFLAKRWDIPELAALRMAITDAYYDALADEDLDD